MSLRDDVSVILRDNIRTPDALLKPDDERFSNTYTHTYSEIIGTIEAPSMDIHSL